MHRKRSNRILVVAMILCTCCLISFAEASEELIESSWPWSDGSWSWLIPEDLEVTIPEVPTIHVLEGNFWVIPKEWSILEDGRLLSPGGEVYTSGNEDAWDTSFDMGVLDFRCGMSGSVSEYPENLDEYRGIAYLEVAKSPYDEDFYYIPYDVFMQTEFESEAAFDAHMELLKERCVIARLSPDAFPDVEYGEELLVLVSTGEEWDFYDVVVCRKLRPEEPVTLSLAGRKL